MKKAFTLAEVMIVLVVIGILVAILLPTAQNLTPDEALMKFQKNNANLANAIRNLTNSEEYFYNGDFGLDRDNSHISLFFVEKDFQRHSFGKKLLQTAIENFDGDILS